MGDVKRYYKSTSRYCRAGIEDACQMYEGADGAYVKYDDYTAMQSRAEKAEGEVEGLKHDLQQAVLLHESCHETRRVVTEHRNQLKQENEQLETALAGITAIATGCGLESARECVEKRQWAFHAAMKDVLELRDKYDNAEAQLQAMQQPVMDEEWEGDLLCYIVNEGVGYTSRAWIDKFLASRQPQPKENG